ncbi:MAG: type II toxin-antitoxin system VapB family antitoxin [Pseudomonadota bacterium]
MPLYIRDDSVDTLAEKVWKATGARNKTEAVRAALRAQLDAIEKATPLTDHIRALRAQADEIGPVDREFDMKRFTDDLWDDGVR